jgi:hypothetical protein
MKKLLLVLSALWLSGFASAQFTNGSIAGNLVDQQGAAVPQAAVTLKNEARQLSLNTNSDATGRFFFPSLIPGEYELQVKAKGFKTLDRKGLTVQVNERLTLGDIQLSVGEVTETVEVSAEVVTLKTESAERSNQISAKQMENIAVNGRSYLGLAGLTAGVVSTGNFQVAGTAGLGAISANGQRGNQNQLLLNGISNVDTGNNGDQLATISLDSVQEFRILTGVYQAEYGRSVGAQIIVQTKSGSRDFHGSAYWFRRHESLNANNWVRNRDGLQRQLYRYQYPGYTIGGPVYIPGVWNRGKDKAFFFWSQEFQRQLQPEGQRLVTVPTALERTGDFSQTLDQNGNPLGGVFDSQANALFPGAIIPRNRWQPSGAAILNFYPLPNRDQRTFRNHNYQTQISTQRPRREDLIRADYNVTERLRIWGHVIRNKNIFTSPYGSFVLGSNLGIFKVDDGRPGRSLGSGFTWVLSPVMTTEFTFGYGRNDILIEPNSANPDALTRSKTGINLPVLYPDAIQRDFIPQMTFGGNRLANSPTFGTNNAPFVNYNDTSDFVTNTTRIFNNHTVKFGAYIQWSRKNQTSFANANGNWNFGDNPNNPFDTRFGYANALLGVFNSFTQARAYANGQYRYTNSEFYIQDTFKVTRNLTFDYGVRLAWIQPQHDQGLITSSFLPGNFNPANAVRLYFPGTNAAGQAVAVDRATGQELPSFNVARIVPGSGDFLNGILIPGKNASKYLMRNNGVHAGPRFGLAWDIFGNQTTVFRAGGGIFYDRFQGNRAFDLLTNPPTVLQPALNFGLSSSISPIGSSITIPIGAPNLVMADPTGVVPRTYSYQAGIQTKLMYGIILDTSYVGSMGRNLQNNRNINAVPYGATFNPANAGLNDPNFLRPYRGYGNINIYEGTISSNYNSFQLTASRRLQNLTFDLNYTFSKALGATGGGDGDFTRIDGLQRFANFGILGIHRKHNMNLNFIYEIPNAFKQMNNKVVNGFAGGWQLSGIYQYTSGEPYGIGFNVPGIGNPQLTGSFTEGARIVPVGKPRATGAFNSNAILNTASFRPPQPGSIGVESSRLHDYWFPINNWNMSLQKTVRVTEGAFFQFRVDTFNTFNHRQINGWNTGIAFRSLTDLTVTNFNDSRPGGFGAVTSVRDPRILQTAIRFKF